MITRRNIFSLAPAILGFSGFASVSHAATTANPPVVIGVAGQSLGAAWRNPASTAWATFVVRMRSFRDNRQFVQFNAASGGSSLLREWVQPSALENYWLEDNLTAGPLLLKTKQQISNLTYKPKVWLWVQGEQDSMRPLTRDVRDDEFVAKYLAGLKTIISSLGAPVFIQPVGPRIVGGVTTMTGFRSQPLVRRAQYEAMKLPDTYEAARPDLSITLADSVHPTYNASGFGWIGIETANAMRGRL